VEALALDAGNWYVRDLLSYSQYRAGREAVRDGRAADAARYFEDAVASVRQVIEAQPNYIGGYVELAIYECARDRPKAAIAAYDAALARTTDARDAFANRAGEIPQRCSALQRRLAAR
jgi:cytochrome c-type biogenesis protein CcmH/NrfG